MVGKFSNTISKVNNNNSNSGNDSGKNSVIKGIPVIVVTTPTYLVKPEDMGCMLLVSANCTFDFTNVNDTSTCIIYIVNKPSEINEVTVVAHNKEIIGSNITANDMYPNFVTIYNGKVYTYKAF